MLKSFAALAHRGTRATRLGLRPKANVRQDEHRKQAQAQPTSHLSAELRVASFDVQVSLECSGSGFAQFDGVRA